MSNSISFTGNLGKDAEIKQIGDNQLLEFSVANSVGYGTKKDTVWFKCALWGKRGEAIAQYMTKGTSVFVTGELSLRTYTNKEGVEKTSPEVRVNGVDFVGGKQDAAQQPQSAPVAQPPVQAETSEDMPF